MKIEITDDVLGDFIPFAVFVFKPPDQVMVHVICSTKEGARSVPQPLAEQLLKDLLSAKAQLFLSNPTTKGN